MDVIVVGSCNMDLICYSARLPKLGETLHGHKFQMGYGGKGANQCVMAARLGAKTMMVSKVGEDMFGGNYVQSLKDNGVNTDHVGTTKDAATGVATINVDDDGNNAIVIASGANMLLTVDDINAMEDVIKSAKVLVCQLEIEADTTLAAIKLAKKHDVLTIFNPAPAMPNLNSELYTTCDIFCPNETETELLLGAPVKGIDDAKSAIKALLTKGCNTVVITMGENGCVFGSKSEPPTHVPAEKVKPLDTTGAGDSFVGSLAFYLSTSAHASLGFAEKLRRASAIATVSVQGAGTQSSYPWRKDLPQDLFQ